MNQNHNAKPDRGLTPLALRFGLLTLLAGTGLALSLPANAAPPPANSVIGNQAVAEYLDASGAKQTTLSNLVQTTVQAVGSFTLEPPVIKNILSGQTAYLPHILTNNGNDKDDFTLSFDTTIAGFTNGSPVSVKVYPDANGDGMPDDLNAPLCTVTNAATLASACPAVTVAGGGTAYNFVIAVQSPNGLPDTSPWEKFGIKATAATTARYTAGGDVIVKTDTVNIASGAIFDVTKSISIPGGPASAAGCTVANYTTATGCQTATYTLTYTNRGDAAGTVQIQDIIGQGATVGMAYIPDTTPTAADKPKWSNSATALTDAAIVAATADATDGAGAKIYYEKLDTSATVKTLNAFVTGVQPNTTASISFKVLILPTAVAGTSTTTNTAQFGTTTNPPSTTPSTPPENSNPSPYIVGLGQKYDLVANKLVGASTDGNNIFPGTTANDLVVVATGAAGQEVFFNNYIWNTGDGTDTFNVQIRSDLVNSFPTGTSFQLFKADGVNPLLDTTGDGVPDTGPLLANAGATDFTVANPVIKSSYKVVVKATIPLNACTLSAAVGSGGTLNCASGNGPYSVQITATSNGDKTNSNNVFDQLTTITSGSVDLKNTATSNEPTGVTATIWNTGANALGAGTIGTATNAAIDQQVITAKTGVSPGSTQYFDLPVYNTGSTADSYALTYDVDLSKLGTIDAFTEGRLPAGWKVTFRKNTTAAVDTLGTSVCSATTVGAAITSTDLINGSGLQHVCAEITISATAQSVHYVHFKVESKASGARDVKIDSLDFTAVGGLSLIPNNTGQVYPGGTIVYPHTLSASGLANCTGMQLETKMDQNQIGLGWNTKVYVDTGSIGVIDGETPLTPASTTVTGAIYNLANVVVGTPRKLLVQVFAPNGAAVGVTNLVDLIATGDCDPTAGVQTSTATANDLTTVIIGQLRLYKKQSIDIDCNGADGAYGVGNISAKPGECIEYEISAINEGAAAVKDLKINDTTPVFTKSEETPLGSCSAGGTISQPGDGVAGPVICTWPVNTSLNPGNQVKMIFRVKIDQ